MHRPDPRPARNRGFWALRDIPTVAWLLLAVLAVLMHRSLPAPTWLMLHLLLLGAVTHAILVWSQYFAAALLRTRPSEHDRRQQSWRLALANTGAAAVLVGVPTEHWPVTVTGATILIAAVLWHAADLALRLRRRLPGRFGHLVRYYVISAGCLAVGASIGAWMARGDASPDLVVAHAILNAFGWVGVTVAGTLVTLWPTMLRTRADPFAASGATRAMPLLALGVVVAAGGAAWGVPAVVAAGLLGYATGLVVIGISLGRAARAAHPREFAPLSVGFGMLWWIGSVIVLAASAGIAAWTGSGVSSVGDVLGSVAPFLATGFAAQVLLGALSYLIPVVLGGGPRALRAGNAELDRGAAARVATANAALAVYLLPVSSLTRVVLSALYLVAMASFLPLMMRSMKAQRLAKAAAAQNPVSASAAAVPLAAPVAGRRAGQAVAGLIAVVLAVAVTGAIDPTAMGWGQRIADDPNAPVTVVDVSAANMRFTPNRIEVPSGNRLEIRLVNSDPSQTHDLVLANGAHGSRLSPGASETIDVGVVTGPIDGWCSIVGHRQLGMTLTVVVAGGPAGSSAGSTTAPTHDMTDMPGMTMPGMTMPGMTNGSTPGAAPAHQTYDPVLAPLPPSTGPVTHRITLTITEQVTEVAPGVTQTLWLYNGTAPGPVLHGRIGDTFVVTLVNHGSMGHSIDFHAGEVSPDEPMRTIDPGQSLVYTFTANRAGIWMYHCSTMPMSAHIANGMYGAVVIDPPGLAPVDHTYVMVQGEYYLGPQGGVVDTAKLAAGTPDLVTFNGYANQYDGAPLAVTTGQRVRIWVLDAGPNRESSFHVVGGQFDTVFSEGAYLLDHSTTTGSQALALAPAQGGFVELTFPAAGHYSFVSHVMVDAERGAHGVIAVTDH